MPDDGELNSFSGREGGVFLFSVYEVLVRSRERWYVPVAHIMDYQVCKRREMLE